MTELILKRSRCFPASRTETAGKRTAVLGPFRMEGFLSLFLTTFKGAMAFTAAELIFFMEITVSLMVMVETILLLFPFFRSWLGLFDG